ncbi:MAG: hypothetical protein NUW24_14255 [Anaerolineae bacterium]|nr:hypothetical protein [Anaerolineae bacterium]MDH7475342.1 hypothetical protein [Anaerolineae bacterium]
MIDASRSITSPLSSKYRLIPPAAQIAVGQVGGGDGGAVADLTSSRGGVALVDRAPAAYLPLLGGR